MTTENYKFDYPYVLNLLILCLESLYLVSNFKHIKHLWQRVLAYKEMISFSCLVS